MNTKYILTLGALMISFMTAPVLAHAENTSVRGEVKADVSLKNILRTKENMEERNKDMRQKYEDRRDDLENRKRDIRSRIDMKRDDMGERIKVSAEKKIEVMEERTNAAITRLEMFMTRIDSRIAKLKAEGKDMSAAEKISAEIKVDIGALKTKAVFSHETTVEAMNENKDHFMEIKNDLMTIHKKMMQVLMGMGFSFEAKADASIKNN